MNDLAQQMIAPVLSLVFVAGGGWFTLEAVADESKQLQAKVEELEKDVGSQDVLEVKVQQVEDRLEKMEKLLEKTIDLQTKQAINTARICSATGADCR